VTVQIGEAQGDRSVVPAGRRYLLEVRMDLPGVITVAGHGELPRLTGPDQTGAGWWADARGFTSVRLPDAAPPLTVTLRI
jgi:hypothetical protein